MPMICVAQHMRMQEDQPMYRGRIEKDFNTWVSKGMLDAGAAKAMLAEYDGRETVFSAGRVLLVLAAILVLATAFTWFAQSPPDESSPLASATDEPSKSSAMAASTMPGRNPQEGSRIC